MSSPDPRGPRYCSTYCEHNAGHECQCAPCVFIREHAHLRHEDWCGLNTDARPDPQEET